MNLIMNMDEFYTSKKKDKSTVEFTITIPRKIFTETYQNLLKENTKKADVKGFRKGKVPADLVESEISQSLRLETFEKLIPLYLSTALQKENISPVAPPDYKDFPKLEGEEDITFTVEITVMPEFKLGNLKKIKIEKETVEVPAKEVDEALENIFKNNKSKFKEMNNDWAKETGKLIGNTEITNMKELRKYVEDTLKSQKEHMLKHKQEDSALEQAIKLSEIEIPEPAIKYEALEREHSFERDMQQRSIKIEDFLKANNITLEKMRELWLKDAKQALETDVFLRTYAKDRNLQFSDEDLAKKIEDIKKQAPEGTDKSIFDNEDWKEYIRRVSLKDLAFKKFSEEVISK